MSIKEVKRFSSIGKISGPEYDFFIRACEMLLDSTPEDNNAKPDDLPLFSLLSPHHRLSLIADICNGLLDKTTPLPPDTLEHYSTYYAIYSFAMLQLQMEIEEYGDGTPDCVCFNNHTKGTSKYDEFKVVKGIDNESVRKDEEITVKEKIMKKKARKQAKKTIITADDLNKEMPDPSTDPELTKTLKDSFAKLRNIANSNASLRPSSIDETRIDPHHIYWRKLLHAVYSRNNPSFPFHYTSTDLSLWSFMHTLKISASGLTNSESDRKIIFGEIDSCFYRDPTPAEVIRYQVVTQRVSKASEEYECTWTPLKTYLDYRTIISLDIDNESMKAENSTGVISTCRAYCTYIREHVPIDATYYGRSSQAYIAWKGHWHEHMISNNYDYSKLEDRLKGVREISSDPNIEINCMPAWTMLTHMEWSPDPAAWRKKQKLNELKQNCSNPNCLEFHISVITSTSVKFCSKCMSAAYCSRDCQVQHWKIHKSRCNLISPP